MTGWLDKVIPSKRVTPQKAPALPTVPVVRPQGQLAQSKPQDPPPETLSSASIIYGIAASVLSVLAVFFLFSGRWFTGILVMFPAACFLGFALQYLRTK